MTTTPRLVTTLPPAAVRRAALGVYGALGASGAATGGAESHDINELSRLLRPHPGGRKHIISAIC